MGFGWEMLDNLEDDENFFKIKRIDKEQYKQKVLDQSFLNAQLVGPSKAKKKVDLKKTQKKPVIKTGFIVIILALFAIIAGQILPWMYFKYDASTECVEYFVNRDFEIENTDIADINPAIIDLFSPPKSYQGKYSSSYIGLTINDFKSVPITTFYMFLVMIVISVIFISYLIIDKFKKFNLDNISMVHSIFAASCILLSLIVLSILLIFIASYFMLYLNQAYIQSIGIFDFRSVYIVPLILIFVTSAIIKICITIMKINYRDIENRIEKEKCEKRFQTFKFGAANND